MIGINLLPAQSKMRKTILMLALGFLLVLFCIQIILVLVNKQVTRKVVDLRSSIEITKDGYRSTWPDGRTIQGIDSTNLDKQVQSMQRDLNLMDQKIIILERDPIVDQWVILLPRLANDLPASIWLMGIELTTNNTLFLEGKGLDYHVILHWMDSLLLIPPVSKSYVRYLQLQQEVRFGVELWGGDGTCF